MPMILKILSPEYSLLSILCGLGRVVERPLRMAPGNVNETNSDAYHSGAHYLVAAVHAVRNFVVLT
jgi:hypothetical protein